MVAARMKYRKYNNIVAQQYFWRTYQQQEIDLIEDAGTNLNA